MGRSRKPLRPFRSSEVRILHSPPSRPVLLKLTKKMHRLIEIFFKLKDLHTNIRIEIVAGLTTFMTMAYIIFINPVMVSQAGMDFGAAMMATSISAAVATIMMGLYTNYPIVLASGMGENAFLLILSVSEWVFLGK